jgi:hypothetical protein
MADGIHGKRPGKCPKLYDLLPLLNVKFAFFPPLLQSSAPSGFDIAINGALYKRINGLRLTPFALYSMCCPLYDGEVVGMLVDEVSSKVSLDALSGSLCRLFWAIYPSMVSLFVVPLANTNRLPLLPPSSEQPFVLNEWLMDVDYHAKLFPFLSLVLSLHALVRHFRITILATYYDLLSSLFLPNYSVTQTSSSSGFLVDGGRDEDLRVMVTASGVKPVGLWLIR